MVGECASIILSCASVHHVIGQFGLGMAGPAEWQVAICTADYVSVFYFEKSDCWDELCDATFTPVTQCDQPEPASFSSRCSYRAEFEQEHFCTSLFDSDGDRDIDLVDFASLQNRWS